jgi:hypothetical protein
MEGDRQGDRQGGIASTFVDHGPRLGLDLQGPGYAEKYYA